MKSKIFVKAAEIIMADITEYSCHAIACANGGIGELNRYEYVACDELYFYQKLFKIEGYVTFLSQFRSICDGLMPLDSELKEIRVLALLLAREVMKSEKKSYANSQFGGKFKQV